jgi:hypothetical protein
MIVWTNDLIEQINSYSRAALSYSGQDGYPVTLPLSFTFDRVTFRFTLSAPAQPPAIATNGASQVSLTLLRYDPQVANERYLLFYGQVMQQGDRWSFAPARVTLP